MENAQQEELAAKPRELEGLDALKAAGALADAQAFPAAEETPKEPDEAAEAVPVISSDLVRQAMPEAAMFAGMAAGMVEKRWGVELSDETKEQAAQKLAPLLVKYDMDSPFLRKWRLEIDAAVFLGATAYGIYQARKTAAAVEAAGGIVGSNKVNVSVE